MVPVQNASGFLDVVLFLGKLAPWNSGQDFELIDGKRVVDRVRVEPFDALHLLRKNFGDQFGWV